MNIKHYLTCLAALLAAPAIWAQPSTLPTTSFTRNWLRATNAPDAVARLGITVTNTTILNPVVGTNYPIQVTVRSNVSEYVIEVPGAAEKTNAAILNSATITGLTGDGVRLAVRPTSGQSNDVFQVQNTNNAMLFGVSAAGNMTGIGTLTVGGATNRNAIAVLGVTEDGTLTTNHVLQANTYFLEFQGNGTTNFFYFNSDNTMSKIIWDGYADKWQFGEGANATIVAGQFEGGGAGLTDLDAAELSGQVPVANLGTNVAMLDMKGRLTNSAAIHHDETGLITNATVRITLAMTNVSAAHVLTGTKNVVVADTTASAFAVTLPATNTVADGWFCIIKLIGTNTLTVTASAGSAIDGEATALLDTKFQGRNFIQSGTNWWQY